MRKHIVIDYINLITVFHLALNHKGSDVTALFCPTSKSKERFLIRILSIFKIRYQLDKMKFSKLPVNPYQEVLVDTNDIVDKLSLFYESDNYSKTMSCFNSKLRRTLFNLLWRPNSIIKYAEKYYTFDAIYISLKTKKIFQNRFQALLTDQHCIKKLFFYNGNGKVDDLEYWSRIYMQKKIRFLAYIFYIPIEFKNRCRNIDSLFFSHDKKTIQGFLNGTRVSNFISFTHKIAWPDGTIGESSESLIFRRIYWKDYASYLLHLKDGLAKFYPTIASIGLDVFIILMREWVSLFLLRLFYKKHNIKIIYSNYDSDFTQLALAIASDDLKIASFSAIWSLGSFPHKHNITLHKFADRFFIWGEWHYSLLSASNDESSGYVTAGYIGDIDLPIMQKEAALLRTKYKKNYKKIISLYDTSKFYDLFFNEEIAEKLLNVVMKVAKQSNSLVILKTKFKSYDESKFLRHYSNNLILDSEKSSLIAALASDVVIGIANSSPLALAAISNKHVVSFNSPNTVWDHWKSSISSDFTMVESLKALNVELTNKLNMDNKPYSTEKITPFFDGKTQLRMAHYMNEVSDKIDQGKNEALEHADSKYTTKYGFDKIIINE